MPIKFTISNSEFEQAFSQTRITARYKEALRQIMVKGVSHLSIAEKEGLHKQSLSRCCNVVKKQFLTHTETPTDWITTTVSLPPEYTKELESLKSLEIEERLKIREEVSNSKL